MVHFPENPWISSYRTSDHHAVTTRFSDKFFCFFRRIHIPVSNNRNRNRLFDPADCIPVRFSCVILLPCPSMDCNSCCAGILDDLRNFYRIHRISLKTNTDFGCYRLFYRMRNLRHNLTNQLRILEKRRALAIVDYFRHRAAHVDIQYVKRLFFNTLCHLCHQIRFASKNLHGHRMLRRIDLHQRNRIFIMERNCLRTDHLRTEKSCSLLFAKHTKRKIRHTGHRRKDKRIFHLN